MPKRISKEDDINVLATSIVEKTISASKPQKKKKKNPAAVALGRLGGLKGGKARALKLSAKRRKAIAQKAAKSRWNKKKQIP